MKLYEIDREILSLIDKETDEILDWDRFDELQMERDRKIENVVLWIKNLSAEAEACKKEKQAFSDRQTRCEKKIKSLKEWLKNALDYNNFKSEDGRAVVQFRKTPESVVIADGAILPPVYLRYKDPEPDKTAIKKAIKAGETVEGATLITKQNMQIK